MHWRAGADKGEVRRCIWVCGDQRVLVEEVVDTTRTQLNVVDLDYVTLSAATAGDERVWAATTQYPLTPAANRLVVIRDADQMGTWAPLESWFLASRALAGVHLLWVSNAADLPHEPGEGRRKGSLKPHVELIQSKRRLGQTVRCALPGEAESIAWVRRRCQLDAEGASYLLQRTRGDLGLVAGICAQISLFPGLPSTATLDQLCPLAPPESFTDALIAGDKRAAFAALPDMDDRDRLGAIGLLASRLDLLGVLWRAVRAGRPAHEIHSVPPFLVRQYLPHARDYDPGRCLKIRGLLAVVDDAYRRGARVGVMEALIALF